jgi:hypothetical protein
MFTKAQQKVVDRAYKLLSKDLGALRTSILKSHLNSGEYVRRGTSLEDVVMRFEAYLIEWEQFKKEHNMN